MIEDSAQLCTRIRLKCARRGWYGPDNDAGARLYKPDGTPDVEWFIRQRGGFLQAPATHEAIARTEEALGHPFPPLLRDLYTLLANGGFGPHSGLEGVFGEILYGDSEYDEGTVRQRPVRTTLHPYVQHDDCLLLCEGGCNSKWGLHLSSGVVLRFTMAEGVRLEAATLGEWLDRWIISDDTDIQRDVVACATDLAIG